MRELGVVDEVVAFYFTNERAWNSILRFNIKWLKVAACNTSLIPLVAHTAILGDSNQALGVIFQLRLTANKCICLCMASPSSAADNEIVNWFNAAPSLDQLCIPYWYGQRIICNHGGRFNFYLFKTDYELNMNFRNPKEFSCEKKVKITKITLSGPKVTTSTRQLIKLLKACLPIRFPSKPPFRK
jgi:hypothetical protein